MLKNWCFWTVVLEKTRESPLDIKEIKPVNPKRNQPWMFIWKIDAEAEAPILWPPDANNRLTRKDSIPGKDWGQEEKGVNRGWDGWKASLTQWTWVWANSKKQWMTGKAGVLQSTGSESDMTEWLHSNKCLGKLSLYFNRVLGFSEI